MSPAQRRYLLLEQGVGAGVFNFLLNAAIAWLMFRHQAEVPLWGQQSIAGDTMGTSLLLPFLTCLIVTAVARRQVRAGKLAPLGWTRASHPVLRWLPRATVWRGLVLGLACAAVLAPAVLLVLRALAVASLDIGRFVVFKASFAALAAVLVTPPIALWAIADAPGSGVAVRRGSAA
jgi:hypothetical protein